MMNKNLMSIAIGSAISMSSTMSFAELPSKANLSIAGLGTEVIGCTAGTINPVTGDCTNPYVPDTDEPGFNITGTTGSFFNLGGDTFIENNNGINIGTVQPASGSHGGPPGCENDGLACNNTGEIPNIDVPWLFAGNTGMHQTTSAVTIINDDGAGTVQLDFSGWNVAWNSIASIPMGGGGQECGTDVDGVCLSNGTDFAGTIDNGTGIAIMTCDAICAAGESYVIDAYLANVPLDDPSGFGGAPYTLHLEGVITDTNQAPVATNDPLLVSINPNTAIDIDLAGNVTDPDGDGIVGTTVVIAPYAGIRNPVPTLVPDGIGGVNYLDNDGTDTGEGSPDTFTYTVEDGVGQVSASITVEVTIITGNIPPIANDFTVITDINTPILIDVVANATDSDGNVDEGSLALSNAMNGIISEPTPAGTTTFTPTADSLDAGSFNYTVDDDGGVGGVLPSNLGTVTVTVNDPPVANNTTINVNRNSTGNLTVANFVSDSDGTVDLDTILATDGLDSGGTTVVDLETGQIIYTTPDPTFIGQDTYTYTVQDNTGSVSAPGTVTVLVNNIVPIAVNDAGIVRGGDANVVIDVLANDSDVDGTLVSDSVIATNGSNGTTSVDATGAVTYTPDGSLLDGQDSFTYTVEDNNGGISNAATVVVSLSSGAGVLDAASLLVLQAGLVASDAVEPAIGDGSWFSMELSPGAPTHISIVGFNSIQLGATQLGSVQAPPGPGIDEPWLFVGNLGVHQTTGDLVILTDDGTGNVTLDFSVWDVSWNGITSIPLGEGADNGVATMTCTAKPEPEGDGVGDCSTGDAFIIEYRATVPPGDPSNFGGVSYRLHLEGVIRTDAPSFGGGDENAPFDVETIVAVDDNNNAVAVAPGSVSVAADNDTGVHLSADDIGIIDPLLNPNDGVQCIGGCVDFVVSGVTQGGFVDLVFTLNAPIPSGGKLRKLIDGLWGDFDTSAGGQVGSAGINEVTQTCQVPSGVFEIGLREGHRCLFMRIFDGGPNDADGTANGVIVDPSGVLLAGSSNLPSSSKSSGALGWMSLIFVLSLISLARIKRA